MKCPRCQQENPPQANFCLECATPLALRCPNCGTQLPAGAKFCFECATPVSAPDAASRVLSPETYTPKHLAERILNSKAALEGERKQVTVLFADLKGSMELLADRDPEEARKLLDPVLEHMMEAVHRYEGTVNQVMGDGIMALFGAPLAHEDHAVRACYAALRMQEAVAQYAGGVFRSHGLPLHIRVGLNSGEVVVRAILSDLRMDYSAVGQTTHLAARMEQMASPGMILLAPATQQLAGGHIQTAALGPVPVKGLSDPVEIYALTGVSQVRRFHAAAARGLTRFVGRASETEQIGRALAPAQAGRGQVIAVVGEPGVGKSRLVHEFTRSYRTEEWLVLETGAVSYGKATSYLPVIDLLKSYFKVHARATHRELREKVTGNLLSLDRSLDPILPAVLSVLDVPVEDAAWLTLDPAQRRLRTLDAVKRLLLRESQDRPLVVVFEDLHWIDAETQAVLDGLVESLPTARLVLLVTYRPEYQHGWVSKTYYSQLRLDALPPDSAGELLTALLGEDSGLEPLKRLLVKRGNPFFIEESIRTLVETGVLTGQRGSYRLTRPIQGIEVPATVQVILATRIDRLAEEDKQLLQTASVIGKDVPFGLLHAVAEAAEDAVQRGLMHLQAREFLYQTRLYPEPAYTFKHALTHDVTYGSLLRERRQELHARTVDVIERLYADRLDEEVERLAHHALRGQLREKAIRYLRQAGLKATARSALQDARGWFEQALGALEALPESRAALEQGFDIRLELRPTLSNLGEARRTLERLREAKALADKLDDDRRRSHVCVFLTNAHNDLGELDDALETGMQALETARRLGDLPLRILAASYLQQTHYLRGQYRQVIERATDNLALPADWLQKELIGVATPTAVWDRGWIMMSLAQLGRFAEAAEYETEAIRLAEATNRGYPIAYGYRAAATLHLLKGDWMTAQSRIEKAIAAARSGNAILLLPYAIASSAWALAQMNQSNEALDRVRDGERLLERHAAMGVLGRLSTSYHALGRAWFLLGRHEDARRLADRAIQSAPRQPGFAAQARHLLGDIATHPDRFDAATGETNYRAALAVAEELRMRPLVAHCHFGLGTRYRRTGHSEQALEHLTTATTMYREMGMMYWLENAQREIE